MRHELLVTSADLKDWARKLDSEAQLPRLIRRLIQASAQGITRIAFPADEDIRDPGFDGVLICESGGTFAPTGVSVWELSTREDVGTKANEDYERRTAAPGDVVPAETTYVAVTLRKWRDKQKWATKRRKEGVWKDVRAYDAGSLQSWLEEVPGVHHWLSTLLGRRPQGATDLETYWRDWSAMTEPPVLPAFLLSGRRAQAESITNWLRSGSKSLAIRAESREEALAIFAATVLELPEVERYSYLTRAVVARDQASLLGLASTTNPLLLLPAPKLMIGDEAAHAEGKGHRLVLPFGAVDSEAHDALNISALDSEESTKILENQGLRKERARDLGTLARRSLLAFRRVVARRPELSRPSWGQPDEGRRLVPALLAGSWIDTRAGDREVLAALSRTTYAEFNDLLIRWANEDDAPLRRIGDTWRLHSLEDAWGILGRFLAREDLDRFNEQVQRVLGTPDPKFDLPDKERWLAAVHGAVPPSSKELHRGLAESLAMLGSRGESTSTGAGTTAADRARLAVQTLLATANTDWRIWASLADWGTLPLLAEAAPDEFLAAVDKGVRGDKPVLRELFRDSGDSDGLTSSSPHTSLLWALETLAWNPNYLTHTAVLLARLTALDPGGTLGNRPIQSLRGIFLSWHPQTAAALLERISALDAVRRQVPEASWKLLAALLPENHGVAFPTSKPTWREWGSEASQRPTRAEFAKAIDAVVDRALLDVGQSGARWVDLIESFGAFYAEQHRAIVEQLGHLDVSVMPDSDREAIWHALRKFLSQHRSHPDADWAVPKPFIDELGELYPRFAPRDLLARYRWVFASWPVLPEGRQLDHDDGEKAVAEARNAAVRAVHAESGMPGILNLAALVEAPGYVGLALAESGLAKDDEDTLLASHLASPDAASAVFARGLVSGAIKRSGREWAEQRVKDAKSGLTPEQRADILECLPCDQVTIELAAGLGPTGDRRYWNSLNVFAIPPDQAEYAVRKLLEFDRPYLAVDLIDRKSAPVPSTLILEVLDRTLRTPPGPGDINQMFAYHIGQLFEMLAESDADMDRIASLEWAFLPILDRQGRKPQVLHRELASNPEFFVEVLCLVYRGKGEPRRELSENEATRAHLAHDLLGSWRTPPGSDADGTLDGAALASWVRAAREKCEEVGRAKIGDQEIGQVLSGSRPDPDGIWPPREVRDLIEETGSDDLEKGIALGAFNGRGVVSKAIREGGAQEEAIAARYETLAKLVAGEHARTAAMLRTMAESYRRQARSEDEDAEDF